jgi:hypothetical protein
MKDVLLLHYNARPDTGLPTREAIAKMGWTVLPHPVHSPDLTHSDYNLFGPVMNALYGRHFAENNELNQSFRHVPRSGDRDTGIQRLNQRLPKCVENEEDFVEIQPHNSKSFVNHPCKLHCYCKYIF